MNAKITYRLIKSLAPAEKPYEVTDADLAGFTLRVQPTASHRISRKRTGHEESGSAHGEDRGW